MDPQAILKTLGIDLAEMAEDLEPIQKAIKFDIPLGALDVGSGKLKGMALKAFIEKDVDGDDQMYVGGIASSTIMDRHGDTILPTALMDMERDANDNLTMFLNHKAEVPEGIAGSVVKASIEAGATDKDGNPLYDLNFEKVRIDKTNDRAVKTWKSVKGGTKLGMSIGARIPEGGAVRNKKTGALLIAHVELLETSFVGIPANPRSWVDYVNKAFDEDAALTKGDIPEVDVDGKDSQAVAAAVEAALGKAEVVPPVNPPTTPPVVPPVTPAVTMTAGEDGTETITLTSNPSQGAPESGPGADGATTPDVAAAAVPPTPDTEELVKLATPDLIQMLVQAQTSVGEMTLQLIDASRDLAKAEQRATDAEREAADVAKQAAGVLRHAAQIMQRLEKLPVGQKASFAAIKAEYQDGLPDLSGIYTESFQRMLKGDTPT